MPTIVLERDMTKIDDYTPLPNIPLIFGARVTEIVTGLEENGKHDIFMAELVSNSKNSGTLIRSIFPGASFEQNQRHLPVRQVEYLKSDRISITVDMGVRRGTVRVWAVH